MLLADVALPVPIARAFTYAVPDAFRGRSLPGARVVCSFGGRRVLGVVLAVREGAPPKGGKPLAGLLDEEPAVPAELLAFLGDLASYYLAPIGEVMRLALPPADRETMSELATPSLFDDPGGVGRRIVRWVSSTDKVETSPLRGQQAAILAHLRAAGAEPAPPPEGPRRNAPAPPPRPPPPRPSTTQ